MLPKVFQHFLNMLAAAHPTSDAYFLPHDDFPLQTPPDETLAMTQYLNSDEWDAALDDYLKSTSFQATLSPNDLRTLEGFLYPAPGNIWNSPTTHTRANATQRFHTYVPEWANNTGIPDEHLEQTRGIGSMVSGGQPPIDGTSPTMRILGLQSTNGLKLVC
jgi:hypothetical protein